MKISKRALQNFANFMHIYIFFHEKLHLMCL